MAFAMVGKSAIRQTLPAPVEGRHREAARAQITYGLEIFFDIFGAALQNDDRPLRPGGGSQRPKRKVTPSGVLMTPASPWSGTGLAGIEMNFMTPRMSRCAKGCATYSA